MKFRSLALFAMAAGFAVLIGDFTALDAQEKVGKKNKKPIDPPAATTPAAKPVTKPEVKPAAITVATPKVKDAAALAKVIDAEITRKIVEAKLTASAASSDEEFLRRAALDITGVIPSAERAKAFLDDKSPDKRAKLIDELLADPRFGRRMADIWTAKLFPKDSGNRFVLKDPLYKWLEDEFNKNPGWDKFTTSLVTATGTVAHCCMDGQAKWPIGDARAQHVIDIYNSPAYRRLRAETQRRQDASPCNTCTFL